MQRLDPLALKSRFEEAARQRHTWQSLWQDCYRFALPHRGLALTPRSDGASTGDDLFDGTAPDAVDQLAAALLSELTPPRSRWFSFIPGPSLTEAEADSIKDVLGESEEVVQGHFDRSNFALELHQCFLDLVTVGTASLLLEEAPLGSASAFRFTAIPIGEVVMEEGGDGRLDTTYRRADLSLARLRKRFPIVETALKKALLNQADQNTRHKDFTTNKTFPILEAVYPGEGGYQYQAILDDASLATELGLSSVVLVEQTFAHSPFIHFRWSKAPGENYGRSPVMKALPDIKTANKVVELTLKNASIAVTGIWQADDDGVLNPAAVRLVPGTIIPKAVGSQGLKALEPPGRFDVSELMLKDLRGRIRQALLADHLDMPQSPQMTATEVLERSARTSRIMGATFGRLQAELIDPLIARALSILRRRGAIRPLAIDGTLICLKPASPLAQMQGQRDVLPVLQWLEKLAAFGPQALAIADLEKIAHWSAERLGVPASLIRDLPRAGAPTASPTLPPDAFQQDPFQQDRGLTNAPMSQTSLQTPVSPIQSQLDGVTTQQIVEFFGKLMTGDFLQGNSPPAPDSSVAGTTARPTPTPSHLTVNEAIS